MLVVADLNTDLLPQLTKEPEWVKYANRVVSIGYVRNQDMPTILNLSEALLYTSFRESFGLPIIEAMACGIPVITSNTSSMPEIAGTAAIQVNPESSDEIASALVNLLSSPELCKEYAQLGLQRAKEFSWISSAQKTLAIYNECV